MLDLKAITANPEKFKKSLANRAGDPAEIDKILVANEERKKLIGKSENLKAQQNKINQEIAQLKKNNQDATTLLTQMKEMSGEVKKLEAESATVDEKVRELLLRVPNLCHESVPVGASAEDNKIVRQWGEKAVIQGERRATVAEHPSSGSHRGRTS